MRLPRTIAAIAAGTAAAVGASLAMAPAATANGGTTSLAEVLTAGGVGFDNNWDDYDIVTAAVLAVLDDDASSPVSALTDGTVALTAFIPTDRAFRRLVNDLTGTWPSEANTFAAVAGLGLPTVEAVLLYHVVPGATIDSAAALAADGAALTTALGPAINVEVVSPATARVRLWDQDPDDLNPLLKVDALDINKGNLQIAHGITRVLRPVDL